MKKWLSVILSIVMLCTVLGGGALPLTLLERRVDQWIAKEKAKQA